MGMIQKYIYLKNKDVRTRIEYVQGTNTIPIVLSAVDWDVPDGSEARVYVKKPSGKEVYNTAAISGNDITIQPTTQMFAEFGKQLGQVQIVNGDDIAATFLLEFDVEKNLAFESTAVESSDEYGILDELITEAQTAIAAAEKATSSASAAASSANKAASSANAAATAANDAAENLQEKVDAGDFTASVTVGTVTTGNPGTQALVVNSGTDKDAVLDFTIPRGDTGEIENLDEQTIANVVDSKGGITIIPTPYYLWYNWETYGYLVISLPQIAYNIMEFDICLSRSTTGQAIYHVQGNIKSDSTWGTGVTCYATGDAASGTTNPSEIPIRFAHTEGDDPRPCIIIGNGTMAFENTAVLIRNFTVYGTQKEGVTLPDAYRSGWGCIGVNSINSYVLDKTISVPSLTYESTITAATINIFKRMGYTEAKDGRNINGILNFVGENFLSLVYPVGSIYISANNVNPATLFGGTWQQIKDTFLLAAGSEYNLGSSGGEAEHLLTGDEIPAHTHKSPVQGYATSGGATGTAPWGLRAESGRTEVEYRTRNSGGGQPHNNMPPYIAVNIWKRTA